LRNKAVSEKLKNMNLLGFFYQLIRSVDIKAAEKQTIAKRES
jgi:hypothetical protein